MEVYPGCPRDTNTQRPSCVFQPVTQIEKDTVETTKREKSENQKKGETSRSREDIFLEKRIDVLTHRPNKGGRRKMSAAGVGIKVCIRCRPFVEEADRLGVQLTTVDEEDGEVELLHTKVSLKLHLPLLVIYSMLSVSQISLI